MTMTQKNSTSKCNDSMLSNYKNTKYIHMIKKAILTLTTLFVSSTTLATSPPKPVETNEATNFIVTPSVAYRYDVFKWSIPHHYFNSKLSELIWKNHIIQPSVKIEVEPKANQLTFLGQIKYGYILKSPSKSWDYDWEYDPTTPNSKTFSSVRGNILDLSGAVGYSVNLFNDNLLTFYLGYDYNDYRNKDYGCRQLALNQNKLLNTFNQLVSKYFFKNQAPWIGLSVNSPLNDKFTITPTIKFYSFKYVGKGYWLLRDDVKQDPSMKHNVKGIGLGFDMDFLYKYSNNMDFKINLETKKFKMKTGKEQIFLSDKAISGERVGSRKLYDLSLLSSSISVGLKYKI
jgi:hypothetical protein